MTSPLDAPSTLSVAMALRRLSSQDVTAPAIPIPAMNNAASPTSVRNCPMFAISRSAPGDARSRVRYSQPATGKRLVKASAMASASSPPDSFTRYLNRAIDPVCTSPASASVASEISIGGPREKPSDSRSGSFAISPVRSTCVSPSRTLAPSSMSRRSSRPGSTQASPRGGAPTLRPFCSVSSP